jgi:hypothetical protein
MRDRIWTELTQAKHNEEFASLYAERQRTNLKWFNIGVLVFSTGGVMGWTIWDNFPLLACIIIASVSLLRLIQPHIISTEKQISNIDTISNFYFGYYNKLERLWYDNEQKTLSNEAVKSKFFKIKETESELTSLINDTIRTKPKRLVDKAGQHSIAYFSRTFKT